MKPFNLEEYVANPSRKVVTRDGREVRVVCIDRKAFQLPIIALVLYNDIDCIEENEIIIEATEKGKVNGHLLEEYKYDLFFTPEKREGYVNVYENNLLDSIIYPSKEEALNMRDGDLKYITTIKIELEE